MLQYSEVGTRLPESLKHDVSGDYQEDNRAH